MRVCLEYNPHDGTPAVPLCGRADWEDLVTLTYQSNCWECLSICGIDIDSRQDMPVAGVDYEESGCPVCGGTTPPSEHTACLTEDNLGTYYPDPDKPRGAL